MEGKLAYLESQDELKSKRIDNLEQYGRRESLRFSGFEVKENESKVECENAVKIYIKNSLNVDIEESEYNKIHRIGPKITKNSKIFQQIIVTFKGFVLRAKVYRARKHKADIAIHLNLIKRRYLLLKDAYSKDKDCTSVDIAYADINCSLLEELERLLLET